MPALAAVPASSKHAIAKDVTGKFLKIFIVPPGFFSTLSFCTRYGSVTDRMFPENVPPEYVPEILSATPVPSKPALPGTETVKVCVSPAAMVPTVCGNGDPVAEPSVTEVSVTLVAGAPPVFVTVMLKV